MYATLGLLLLDRAVGNHLRRGGGGAAVAPPVGTVWHLGTAPLQAPGTLEASVAEAVRSHSTW